VYVWPSHRVLCTQRAHGAATQLVCHVARCRLWESFDRQTRLFPTFSRPFGGGGLPPSSSPFGTLCAAVSRAAIGSYGCSSCAFGGCGDVSRARERRRGHAPDVNLSAAPCLSARTRFGSLRLLLAKSCVSSSLSGKLLSVAASVLLLASSEVLSLPKLRKPERME
jgi:hypothetical protein